MASRFSPSITIFKNQDDYESLKPINLEGIVDHFVDGCTVLLRDYEVIELPCQHEVSQCASVRFKSRWVFEHREIEPVLINDQTIMIDQGSVDALARKGHSYLLSYPPLEGMFLGVESAQIVKSVDGLVTSSFAQET